MKTEPPVVSPPANCPRRERPLDPGPTGPSRRAGAVGLAFVLAWFGVASVASGADPAAGVGLEVRADRLGAAIAPTLYGVFFEDINYGADGGLYPERVKNRSFEFPNGRMGWAVEGQPSAGATWEIVGETPLSSANPHYLRVTLGASGRLALSNEGFFGMGVDQDAAMQFSVQARSTVTPPPALRVAIVDASGQRLAEDVLGGFGPAWKESRCTLRSSRTEARARLVLEVSGAGTLDLDLVSLFPAKTWKDRPRGLRPDLVQWLADLRPGFLRFPGGCIVEGRTLALRYQWKTTIGPVDERRWLTNRWNDEFRHRPSPDYFQSFGLGFYEYFQLAEDIGAEPLPILNCGMACQFNSGELAPLEELDTYVQDALDLIEFANGPVGSAWGARRAAMGHPEPFGLKYLGIGNEQWGPQYIERYAVFARVLKARHPEIQLISSAGPRPADDLFHFLWPKLRELKADIVDEHCYDRPAWFLNSAGRYDAYDRSGPKVFMGEYAAQSDKVVSVHNRNNWECALAEAAFMTGLERNAEVVVMSAYAPLFGHEEGWQWRPNLIWFDNLRSYGTPNYYVQQLFGRHRGDRVLPVDLTGQGAPSSDQPGLYVTASWDDTSREVILKVVNSAPRAIEARVHLAGAQRRGSRAQLILLTADALTDENSLADPLKVAPATRTVALESAGSEAFRLAFPRWSLTVLRVPADRG